MSLKSHRANRIRFKHGYRDEYYPRVGKRRSTSSWPPNLTVLATVVAIPVGWLLGTLIYGWFL